MEIQYWCHNRKLKTERQEKNETLPCVGDYVSMIVGDVEGWDQNTFEIFKVKKRYFITEEFIVQLILERSSARMVC